MISKISTVGIAFAAIVLVTTSQAIAQAPSVFTIASRIIKDFAGKKVPSLIKEAVRKTPEIVASATAEAVVAHQLFGRSEVGADDVKALLKKFEEGRRTEEELLQGYYDLRVALQEVLTTPPVPGVSQAPIDPCAEAPTHWRSAEAIGAIAAYKDHLQRFANCSFALLAVVRIAELESAHPQLDPCANATVHWSNARAINTIGAYQDHLNRFPSCVFAGLARERIAHLSQPREIAAMQRPIDNLFEAWRRLDLQSYLRQWAPNGIKIDLERNKSFTVAQLAGERGRFFSQLSAVDARYLPAFQRSGSGIAYFNVTYNMTFHYKNGRRSIHEVACESYKVRKESIDWVIVENRDYEPC